MSGIIKKYSTDEVTVIWQPDKCIHSGICVNGLPEVFDSQKRPWVTIQGATTERIIEQVKDCPSGALSYERIGEANQESESMETVVEVLRNGPLLIYGTVKVRDKDGKESMKTKTTAFCRCGASKNKPYCDGSHVQAKFRDE
jgi:uncharacterized Fe-S cluster protein YjdI